MSKTISLSETGVGVDIVGTSYSGLIKATYDELVALFGEPEPPYDDGKVNSSWNIEFFVEDLENETQDYVTATIYDWKEKETPMGSHEWHVGGYGPDALYTLEDYLLEQKHANSTN